MTAAKRPAYDFDGSALWNQTPDGARIMTRPCHYCKQAADLTQPEHGFNILTGTHEACSGNDYCGVCFSASVWFIEEKECPNCGNRDQTARCDSDTASHARAEQRAGYTG